MRPHEPLRPSRHPHAFVTIRAPGTAAIPARRSVGDMNPIHDLARDLGVHERTLRRAIRLGLVKGGRPLPRCTLLDPGEGDFLRRHWPLLSGLRAGMRTSRTVVFAVALGVGGEGPVEVLVHAPARDGPRELGVIAERLSRHAGTEVRVGTIDPRRGHPPRLLDVLANGRVLVDRRGDRRRLRRRRGPMKRLQPAAAA